MILEGWTLIVYGYTSDDSQCRRVIVVCDGCGVVRDISKYQYHPLCRCCAASCRWSDETRKEFGESRKGENNPNFGNTGEKNPCSGRSHTPDELKKMSDSKLGEKNSFYGKHHTTETLDMLSEMNSGANNPNHGKRGKDSNGWKGGLTPRMQAIRNSDAYKNWRDAVYLRDNWTCMECGARSSADTAVYLNAHHIHPIKDNKNTLLIFDVNNGITLCADCHNKTKGHEEDFIDQYEPILSL